MALGDGLGDIPGIMDGLGDGTSILTTTLGDITTLGIPGDIPGILGETLGITGLTILTITGHTTGQAEMCIIPEGVV